MSNQKLAEEIIWSISTTGEEFQCVHVDFAREQQAEIARLTAELTDLGNPKAGVSYWVDECNKARAERDRLRAAIDVSWRRLSVVSGNSKLTMSVEVMANSIYRESAWLKAVITTAPEALAGAADEARNEP